MFKIVLKDDSKICVMVDVETDERFLSDVLQGNAPHLPGTRLRNEFLKTHWQRAKEWQDVTRELAVSPDGWALTYNDFSMFTGDNHYRFVKIHAFVMPAEEWRMLDSIDRTHWGQFRADLLRVERKEDHV